MPSVGNGNAENWNRFDGEVSPFGEVNHGEASLDNLKEAGAILKENVVGIGEALAGKNILADGDKSVNGAGHYVANLGIALVGAAIAPIAATKDLLDSAVHGVLAGFKKIF
ncbi:MAG: hypothetical protein ACYTFT_18120 [Planctomycetota bacterium]|jgi:hypothetical protein